MGALPASLWKQAQADGRVTAGAPGSGRVSVDRALPFADLDAHSPALPAGSAGSRWGALAAAITIQTVIILAMVSGLLRQQTHDVAPALQASIVAPPAKPPEKPPLPDPLKLQVRMPVAVTPPELRLPEESSPVISLLPSAAAAPSHPVVPPSPPPSEGAKRLTFEQRLLAAVQAAVNGHYPPAARSMQQQGQADVGFDYLDAQVSHLTLVRSSGSALLDKAALATVRDARYPPPPETLLHQLQHFEVWVKFRLEPSG
jgi:periplasmic protein TonB